MMRFIFLISCFAFLVSGHEILQIDKSKKSRRFDSIEEEPLIRLMTELKDEVHFNAKDLDKVVWLGELIKRYYKEPEQETTDNKITTSQILRSIQKGVAYSLSESTIKAEKDGERERYEAEETEFMSDGAEDIVPFTHRTYARLPFVRLRIRHQIHHEHFRTSFCKKPLRELSSAGLSGMRLFLTQNKEFLMKTMQLKEEIYLKDLLPQYFNYMEENPQSLLPKFYAFYSYKLNDSILPFVIMNNLFPTNIEIHEKYDLKGCTNKRKATDSERKNNTYKDVDLLYNHPKGFTLDIHIYEILMNTIKRDTRILEKFNVMDYSLLVGIHNCNVAARDSEDVEVTAMKAGGIPATNGKGEKLVLFIGIIDILQEYDAMRELTTGIKSMIWGAETISVVHPAVYAKRFEKFLGGTVFHTKGDSRDIVQSTADDQTLINPE